MSKGRGFLITTFIVATWLAGTKGGHLNSGTTQGRQADQVSAVAQLLDRYDSGDTSAASAIAATTAGEFTRIIDQFAAAAQAWTAEGGDQERRTLRAASFVLELGWASETSAELDSEERNGRWKRLRPLMEWACRRLRSLPIPSAAERLWFQASFELLLRVPDSTALYGVPGNTPPQRVVQLSESYGGALNHLGHGLARFPKEAEFQWLRLKGEASGRLPVWQRAAEWLAEGASVLPARFKELQAEARSIRLNRTLRTGLAHPGDAGILDRADFLTALSDIQPKIIPFTTIPAIRGRAHLDLGLIAFCFGDRVEALRHFKEVTQAEDPDLRYLGHFLNGRVHALEQEDNPSEAAFRAALTVHPAAQSASLGLAEILVRTKRRGEASRLIDAAIAAASGPTPAMSVSDPWLTFVSAGRLGSDRVLSDLRGALSR